MHQNLPDRDETAEGLDRYMDSRKTLDDLNARLASVGREMNSLAYAIQREVGPDVVILHRGLAFIPFSDHDGQRRGYDAHVCLDLDALDFTRPTIALLGDDQVDVADGDRLTKEFPRVVAAEASQDHDATEGGSPCRGA